MNTGEVLDYTVLSKACQKRALKESQCEGDDKKFPEWRREHLATGECDINFNGSSQPWRRNELLSFGGDPLNYKKKKTLQVDGV